MKKALVCVFLIVILAACAGQNASKSNVSYNKCAPGMKSTGGYWQGETWSCEKEYKNIKKDVAYNKILQSMAKHNYQIILNDKANGVIQAAIPVVGSSKTIPLTVRLRQGKGLIVSASLQVAPTLITTPSAVETMFCEIYSAL